MIPTEPDDGPPGEVPPAVLAYETRLDVTRAEVVRLTGERDAAVAVSRAADDARDVAFEEAQRESDRADAAEARLRAVEALVEDPSRQVILTRRTSYGSVTENANPLIAVCDLRAALSSDVAPQAAGVTREAVPFGMSGHCYDIDGGWAHDPGTCSAVECRHYACCGYPPVADAPAAPEGE